MLTFRELADARPVTPEEMLRQNALRRPQGGPPLAWQLSEVEALLLAQLLFLYKCGDDAGSFLDDAGRGGRDCRTSEYRGATLVPGIETFEKAGGLNHWF